mmetsp:Transcript_6545/g.12932  ORF Transcript_6545/g.12932 Transcript_6545/m.12932 type:complete len:104 (+) Transcript_6545:148-459(+)
MRETVLMRARVQGTAIFYGPASPCLIFLIHLPFASCREKELDSITVKPEDIEMLAFHLELEKPAAERHLRLHKGDLESALNALVVDFPELREARRLAGCAEEM